MACRAGVSDAKACIAALHFLVSNSAKFDVDDFTLTRELQQLGLPKGELWILRFSSVFSIYHVYYSVSFTVHNLSPLGF